MLKNFNITLPIVQVSDHHVKAGTHYDIKGRVANIVKEQTGVKLLVTFPTLKCSSWYPIEELAQIEANRLNLKTILLLYGEI